MDAADPLASFRDQFYIPGAKDGQECIYLCGNSLGLQPKSTHSYVSEELEDWAKLGVDGHFHARHPWLPYHEYLTEQTARLMGAHEVEVVNMNTLTVNLHLMLVSFYRPTPTRHKILVEAMSFPSDRYAVQSQIRYHGYEPQTSLIELSPRNGESTIQCDDVQDVLDQEGDSVALVLLGAINYYNGQLMDLAGITTAGHSKGCVVGFDLAHAAGNVPLELHDWGPDFAVWCSYKYLNGGPGCVAGCFVHERHAGHTDLPRFAGWWGHNKDTRFDMPADYEPIAGAEGWQLSNPSILPLASLRAAMDIFDEAEMSRLRAKSVKLTGYLEFLLKERCSSFVEILTPLDEAQRGCQLSLRVAGNGRLLFDKLNERNVICDWRTPDVIRVAPVPLYNTFHDVYLFVDVLVEEHAQLPL